MWIGFDFDGSLACHRDDAKPDGKDTILLDLLLGYRKDNKTVKILTARPQSEWGVIREFFESRNIEVPEITNSKDPYMSVLYDDRAIGIVRNMGISHEFLFWQISQFCERMPENTPYRRDIIKLCAVASNSIHYNLNN